MTDPKNEQFRKAPSTGSWAAPVRALVNLVEGFIEEQATLDETPHSAGRRVQVDRSLKGTYPGGLRHAAYHALRGPCKFRKRSRPGDFPGRSPRSRSSIPGDGRPGPPNLRPPGAQALADLADPRRFSMLRGPGRRSTAPALLWMWNSDRFWTLIGKSSSARDPRRGHPCPAMFFRGAVPGARTLRHVNAYESFSSAHWTGGPRKQTTGLCSIPPSF